MNVDQHLHRAAHLVRELDVELPCFVPRTPAHRRFGPPILAGLLLIGGTVTVMTHHPAVTEPAISADALVADEVPATGASSSSDAPASPASGIGTDRAGETSVNQLGADGSTDDSTVIARSDATEFVDAGSAASGAAPTAREELVLIRSVFGSSDTSPDDASAQSVLRPDGAI
ncbi:MAG: hypothetical protein AAFP84_07405 [Actinomycetota bacterium]